MNNVIELNKPDDLFGVCAEADHYVLLTATDGGFGLAFKLEDAEYEVLIKMYASLGTMKAMLEEAFLDGMELGCKE